MSVPNWPESALAALVCPHCGSELELADQILGCAGGHRYDVARQGYVSLLGAKSRTDTGDSADMVAARVEFLERGHYAPIAAAIEASWRETHGEGTGSRPLLEIGAGTGYYLSALLDSCSGTCGIAVDASKFAARRAAVDRRVLSVVADAWSALPIGTGTVGAVLSVFAPRDAAEVTRVLAPGGSLMVVTPEPEHLSEIRGPLGLLTVDPGKAERLRDTFEGLLAPRGQKAISYQLELGHSDVAALVRMGPSARHIKDLAQRLEPLPDHVTVTASVTVSRFQRI